MSSAVFVLKHSAITLILLLLAANARAGESTENVIAISDEPTNTVLSGNTEHSTSQINNNPCGLCTIPSSETTEEPNEENQVQKEQTTLSAEDFSEEFPWLDDFHDGLSDKLDDTASWINEQFDEEHIGHNHIGSKTWARIIMGWEPKEGELNKFPLKFKIKMRVPNLKHKINLVFSDNQASDDNLLPLEQARPTDESLHSRDFGAAIQLLHKSTEHSYFRSRIGIGSSQIYARTSHRWKKKFSDNFTVSIEPSIEYYMEDGLGYRFLVQSSYFPNESSEIRGFYSIWDREEYATPKWKKAIYHLSKLDAKSTLITGVIVNGVTEPDYRDEKVTFSTRYRRHALRRWLFFEVEPFLDFERQDDYTSRWGVALRVGGYFGYE